MPQATIYFEKGEDEIIKEFSDQWKLSKHDTIKKIIRNFKQLNKKEVENG